MATGYFLATTKDRRSPTAMNRFDPRFWVINFPRPMMSTIRTLSPNSMKVECTWYQQGDLCGLIWESVDTYDHVLTSYETNKDYSGITFSFNWDSLNVRFLDQTQGPTLTIEGRDEAGNPRTWYVRLWNYKTSGTGSNAVISLNFDALDGGYNLPAEADRVYPGDIDRMFISLPSTSYVEGSTTVLGTPLEGSVQISNMTVTGGANKTIRLYDATQAPHGLNMCTAFDDSYNLTPERILRGIYSLGYRDTLVHYVGMSHFMQLAYSVPESALKVNNVLNARLNVPTKEWHKDFLLRAFNLGFSTIMSVSYEMFNAYMPTAWRQLDYEGAPALTGWEPPSSLYIPTNSTAIGYLQGVSVEFMGLANTLGVPLHFQIGEPWWWVNFTDQKPFFYDPGTVALYLSETGLVAPTITDMKLPMTPQQLAYLDWLGTKLGASTIALRNAVKTAYPSTTTYLLFYAPQVQDATVPELYRANRPTAWDFPAFDVLQLEDYDFVSLGNLTQSEVAAETITSLMGYPIANQHYFSGFVLLAKDAERLWPLINEAADRAVQRGIPKVFYWALPQVNRDNYVVVAQSDVVIRTWAFSIDGHDFYLLRLGNDETLVFDLTTNTWSNWQSFQQTYLNQHVGLNWITMGAKTAAKGQEGNVVAGDSRSGVLWLADPSLGIDQNITTGWAEPFPCKVVGGVQMKGRVAVPCNAVYMLGAMGSPKNFGATMKLRTSDDGGYTWTDHGEVWMYPGQWDQEVSWRSLGQIKTPGRIFELTDSGGSIRIDSLDMD